MDSKIRNHNSSKIIVSLVDSHTMFLSYHTSIVVLMVVPAAIFSLQLSYENEKIENTEVQTVFRRSQRQVRDSYESGRNHSVALKNKKCFGPFCLPKGYNNLIPPSHRDLYGGNKTNKIIDVNLDFDVRVFEVNDIKFTVSLTMYFGIRWKEPRLLKKNVSKEYDGTFKRVDLHMLNDLWLPSVYILNLKSYKTVNIFSEFAGKRFYLTFLNFNYSGFLFSSS